MYFIKILKVLKSDTLSVSYVGQLSNSLFVSVLGKLSDCLSVSAVGQMPGGFLCL